MLIVAAVAGALIAALGLRTRQISGRRAKRSAMEAASTRAKRHRLVAARLNARHLTRTPTSLPRCPQCGEVFRVVEDLWAHLEDHR